jgi:hypothetical protein
VAVAITDLMNSINSLQRDLSISKGMSRAIQWMCVSALLMGGLATQRLSGQTPTQESPTPEEQATSVRVHMVASTSWNPQSGGWAGRVVVMEALTGMTCVSCMYIGAVMNSLLRDYPATMLTSLEYSQDGDYSLHDPVSPDWDIFMRWYGNPSGNEGVNGCKSGPSTTCFARGEISEPDTLTTTDGLVDGRGTIPLTWLGLGWQDQFKGFEEHLYGMMKARIDAELRRPPEAFFHVQTDVHGGKIVVRVKVDSITGRHPKLYLRLMLAEDTFTVHPPSDQNLSSGDYNMHELHNLVYGSAHTQAATYTEHNFEHTKILMGLPLPKTGRTLAYTFDVAGIQRRILGFRRGDTLVLAHGVQWGLNNDFRNDDHGRYNFLSESDGKTWLEQKPWDNLPDDRDWRLNPQRLHVVAFVQDAQSGEVLQAAIVPVDGKRLVLK